MIREDMLVKHRKAEDLPGYPWLKLGRVVWAQTWGNGIGIADVLWHEIAQRTIDIKVDGSSRSYSIPRYSLRRYPFTLLEVISDASPSDISQPEAADSHIKTSTPPAQALRAQEEPTHGITEHTKPGAAELLESQNHSTPDSYQGTLDIQVKASKAHRKPPRNRKARR